MSYGSHRFNTDRAITLPSLPQFWSNWKATCDRAMTRYYNQRIELDPEGEAQQYWNRLNHRQSGIKVSDISDAMLSKLMNTLIQQGISKFAVDCFVLELRRLQRKATRF